MPESRGIEALFWVIILCPKGVDTKAGSDYANSKYKSPNAMLIRITLIVAIIAGLAAGALNFLQVKEKITTTIGERDKFHTERDAETKEKLKFSKLAKETQATLDKTKEELT